MSTTVIQKPVTVPWIRAKKGDRKITVLTAYDFPTAVLLDESGIDVILVGDSLGTVIYGEPNTLSVTLDDIIRHTQAVTKATKRALVVSDLPFMSYQISIEQALSSSSRIIKEGKSQAVKLEGGAEMAETVKALSRAGIPVMAHIGLTPQSINVLGSYSIHGKTSKEREYLLDSAYSLADAGAFALVLECVEASLAQEITQKISVPTIGIGSGPDCDGQVLVTPDLVGLTSGKVPKFVHPLANLSIPFKAAVQEYIRRTQDESSKSSVASSKLPVGEAEGTRTKPTGNMDNAGLDYVARH